MASQPARTLQPRKPAPGTPDPDSTFIRRLMIIIAVALFAAAVWFLSDVLLAVLDPRIRYGERI